MTADARARPLRHGPNADPGPHLDALVGWMRASRQGCSNLDGLVVAEDRCRSRPWMTPGRPTWTRWYGHSARGQGFADLGLACRWTPVLAICNDRSGLSV